MRRLLYLTLGLTAIGLVVSGCVRDAVAPANAADAQTAYDAGLAALARDSHAEALEQFTTAIETTGLPPDLLLDAMLKRALCRAEVGEYEAALGDLQTAEAAATDLDQVHLVRGMILDQKGEKQAARAEFQKARQINPRLQIKQ